MSITAAPRATPPKQPAAFPAIPDWVRWAVVCLLSLGMVIAYCDRVNLSAVLTEIGRDMNMDKEKQGMAMSAFFWTYTIFQIPAGMLVDRFGVRVLYLCGFLLWSVASAATTLIGGSFALLIALRLLVGTGESVVTASSLRYIRDHFEEKRRGLAVGIYMSGTKIGPAVGIPIAAYLAKGYGWQTMFLILGAGSLLWLVPFLLLVKKTDQSAQGSNNQNKAAATASGSVTLRAALRTPAMWGIIIGTYCYMYFVYYCMTWMPTYFRERHGMSIDKMSWFSFVSFGGMAIVTALAGWAADKWIARGADPVRVRKIFTIAGFAAASLQTLSVFTDSQPLMIFFTVASLCGLGLATANYWALTQTLMPGALPVAIQNTAANIGGIVAPWLTGWLIKNTGSFDAPIKAVGFWLVLGIAAYVFLVRREYSPRSSSAPAT
jgi:MFS transporter, ACS family, D-galactonate transporter